MPAHNPPAGIWFGSEAGSKVGEQAGELKRRIPHRGGHAMRQGRGRIPHRPHRGGHVAAYCAGHWQLEG